MKKNESKCQTRLYISVYSNKLKNAPLLTYKFIDAIQIFFYLDL